MNKFFSVTDFRRSVLAYIRRQFRGALIVFLFLGLAYLFLFIGASHGKADTLHDDPDPDGTLTGQAQTDAAQQLTDNAQGTAAAAQQTADAAQKTANAQGTAAAAQQTADAAQKTADAQGTADALQQTANAQGTADALQQTADAAAQQTADYWAQQTANAQGTADALQFIPLFVPSETPRPTKIIQPRSTPVKTGTAGPTGTQEMIGGAAAGSITPESSPTLTPSPTSVLGSIGPITIIPLPPPVSNAVNRTYLLFLALLGIGGGAVSVNRLWGIRENNGSSHAGGGSAVPTTAINPTTVGALGFAAWLTGQVPVLTPDEKEVLTKMESGIGSAANQVGAISDLNTISAIGTEEFLQLTKSSPFLS